MKCACPTLVFSSVNSTNFEFLGYIHQNFEIHNFFDKKPGAAPQIFIYLSFLVYLGMLGTTIFLLAIHGQEENF
jgi:hypothetical protein